MADRFSVVLLDDLERVALRFADWSTLGPDVDVAVLHESVTDRSELVRRLAGADAVGLMRERTPFPREVIEALPRLRLIVTSGPRNAAIDRAAAAERGIVVCGTESPAGSPAELTWALVLGLARGLGSVSAGMRDGGWPAHLGVRLAGKTLGVLGLGKIGRQVAGYGRAFGMDVVAWSQNLTAEAAAAAGARRVEREELFRVADVLSIHVLISARTRGLVGRAELGAMKPSAFLVNTSRGPIVDEAALVEALAAGRLAGAGLDVFDEEPLRADHPLRALPNTLLTSHRGYVSDETFRVYYAQMLEDVVAFRAGTPLRVIA